MLSDDEFYTCLLIVLERIKVCTLNIKICETKLKENDKNHALSNIEFNRIKNELRSDLELMSNYEKFIIKEYNRIEKKTT